MHCPKFPLTLRIQEDYNLMMKCLNPTKLAAKKLIVLGTLASALSACATFTGAESNKNIAQLKHGMSEGRVLSLLGMPDSVVRDTTKDDRWIYEFKRQDETGHNVVIQFHENSLVRASELDGREIASAEDRSVNGSCTKMRNKEMRDAPLCIK
jgi:outer membrane protein assembly factor BamE (lipoprotein component of BamABCDE complex)